MAILYPPVLQLFVLKAFFKPAIIDTDDALSYNIGSNPSHKEGVTTHATIRRSYAHLLTLYPRSSLHTFEEHRYTPYCKRFTIVGQENRLIFARFVILVFITTCKHSTMIR